MGIKKFNMFENSNNKNEELKNVCQDMGYTFSLYTAIYGSEYYRVDGTKFRISDHIQPSHYQSRGYFDVNSVDDILNIIKNPLFKYHSNPIIVGGDFFDMIYIDKSDTFLKNEITEEEYNICIDMNKKKKTFFIENGWSE